MRTTSLIAVLLAPVAACVGVVLLAGQSAAAPAPPLPTGAQAWEYKVANDFQISELGKKAGAGEQESGDFPLRPSFAEGMKKLGEEGWELVGLAPSSQSPNARPVYYFKRPK
jgi:hypothetical protein